MAAETFKAYCAGFFDGEGTVDIRFRYTHGGKYHRFEARVHIYQNEIAPLLAIQSAYGGSIANYTKNSRLVIVGEGMAKFLIDVEPFCIVKKEEVQVALAFINLSKMYPKVFGKRHSGIERENAAATIQKLIYLHEIRAIRERKGISVTKRRNQNIEKCGTALQAAQAVHPISYQG